MSKRQRHNATSGSRPAHRAGATLVALDHRQQEPRCVRCTTPWRDRGHRARATPRRRQAVARFFTTGSVPYRRIDVERYERRGLRRVPDRKQGRGPQLWGEGPAFPGARFMPWEAARGRLAELSHGTTRRRCSYNGL